MTDLFASENSEFRKQNIVTIENANKVENYLIGNGLISVVPIVNCCTLALKSLNNKLLNNNVIIDEKGFGKTTLLSNILFVSNPTFIKQLDSKMYALDLTKLGNNFFNNKILVHDDLITAFSGLNQKTLQQLTQFWTELLSSGNYSQLNQKLENVSCIAMFGMAKENYFKHHDALFEATFFERLVPIHKEERSNEDIKKILIHRKLLKDNKTKIPIIRLPLTKQKKEIKLGLRDEHFDRIYNLGIEFHNYNILSATRAQDYIEKFLMANAFLNKRKSVNMYDLEMYEKIHHLHIGSQSALNNLLKTRKDYPHAKNKELIELSGTSPNTFYKYKKTLKKLGKW